MVKNENDTQEVKPFKYSEKTGFRVTPANKKLILQENMHIKIRKQMSNLLGD